MKAVGYHVQLGSGVRFAERGGRCGELAARGQRSPFAPPRDTYALGDSRQSSFDVSLFTFSPEIKGCQRSDHGP